MLQGAALPAAALAQPARAPPELVLQAAEVRAQPPVAQAQPAQVPPELVLRVAQVRAQPPAGPVGPARARRRAARVAEVQVQRAVAPAVKVSLASAPLAAGPAQRAPGAGAMVSGAEAVAPVRPRLAEVLGPALVRPRQVALRQHQVEAAAQALAAGRRQPVR